MNFGFGGCYKLTRIDVDKNNANYMDDDGVLYRKNKVSLITYPKQRDASEYSILNGTKTIIWNAFLDCEKLTSILIPDSLTGINLETGLEDRENLTIICQKGTIAETYAQENNIKYLTIMDRIMPKTTVAKIKESLESEEQYEVINLEGQVVADTEIAGTGYRIQTVEGIGYYIIVCGDFTGDGKIGIAELARASKLAAQSEEMSWKEKLILDVSGDGNIKTQDLAAISRLATE